MKGYEGVTSYVFIRGASAEDLRRLSSLPREVSEVHSFVAVVGSYDAFVCVQASTLADVARATMESVRGSHSTMSTDTGVAVATINPPGGVTWIGPPPPAPTGFVRVHAAPGSAEGVMASAARAEGVLGVALIAGSFDVFVEVGAESFDDLVDRLVKLNGTKGIVSTDTAFATEIVTDGSDHPRARS